MYFRIWLAILICFVLGASGCMKAAEMAAVPAAKTTATDRPEVAGLPDREFPPEYQERFPGDDSADWAAPLRFLAIAAHFEGEGQEEEALRFLDRAREMYAGRKDAPGEAAVLSRKVLLLSHAGRHRDALALMREADTIWTQPPLQAFPAYLDGRLALMQGNFRRAQESLQRSLADNGDYRADPRLVRLRRDTELSAGIAAVLAAHLPGIAAVYGRPGRAGAETSPAGNGTIHLKEALALNGELRETRMGAFIPVGDYEQCEAEAYVFLGLDEGMRNNGDEAISELTHATDLSRRTHFREGEIWSLLFLGELGLRVGKEREGFQAAELLKETADRYHAAPYRIWARLLLARYAKEQGQNGRAIAALREADDILSTRWSAAEAEMFTEICRAQRRSIYQCLVEMLAAERLDGEALTAAEKGKAGMMLDLLAGHDIGANPAERELLRQERELAERIGLLQRRILLMHGEARLEELLAELRGTETAYRELLDRIEREDERLFSLVALRDIDALSIQALLDEDTTLFAYFAGDRSLYVWAIHRDRIHLEQIDLPREELRRLVFSFLDAIHSKNKRRTDTLSRRAYDVLLKPIIPFVSGERIGFIPDDCLTYFPFAAMNYRGKFLIEGFSLFSLPAVGMFRQFMTDINTSGLKILAFGNPDLEDETLDLHRAVEEVETIRKRIGNTTVLLNKQASETNVEEMMAGYDVLHFAVRGQFDPDEPLRSGLLLTPDSGKDGILTALDIFRLHYSGRAVLLTGCDPLPQRDPEGRSFTALQRAFLFAGSPAVLSSLWLVEERAASYLLEQFYRRLVKQGSLADSLRAAQLRLLREGYPPQIWAAYILTGSY
jgi:CHAT domain-containing protein